MSDIVERLRSYEERFIFQGGSEFAVKLADEIEGLRAAALAEREACAKLCDDLELEFAANEIRSRT